MGMTDNQLRLVRAVAENNLAKAKQYAVACCEEDTTQKNKWEVARWQKVLTSSATNLIELPPNVSSIAKMEDLTNTFIEARYMLSEREKKVYETIKGMYDASLLLLEKHVPYLNATLLYGESGVGKTTFGKYVAYKLGIPYLYINLSQVFDSYLGGTAKNLSNLFVFVNQQKCLLMLDELDCISGNRKDCDGSASKEVARSTTCLIQLLDTITNDHVIIGATNLPENVDPAVRRRFTAKHEIKKLTADENAEFIRRYLDDTGFAYDETNVAAYAEKGHTQAEIMTHMAQRMAMALVDKSEFVTL